MVYHPPIALLKAYRVSLVAPVLTAGLFWWLAGWSADGVNGAPIALAVLAGDGVWSLLWLASAAGLGWGLTRWLVPTSRGGLALEATLGVATMLLADAVLGRAGLLRSPVGAGAALAPGLILLLLRLVRDRPRLDDMPALLLAATPAVAVLLVAACSAPGWLWASEFGGYDAMSYHLELPRAWSGDGQIRGLEYNVYSFLPSYMEGAYLHLFALRAGALDTVFSCQLLHVGMTLIAAAVVGRVATIVAGTTAGRVATVLTLGTPWIVVVGSLAYNEMAVVLLGGGALLLALDDDARPDRLLTGAAVGLLVGAACGASLTAVGFVAVPIGVLLLLATSPVRHAIPSVAVAVVVASCALTPYLVGNALQTGNPVFPFATGALGSGHWTEEQAVIWSRGHASDLGPVDRVKEGLGQLARDDPRVDPQTGRRRAPRSQWSLLPWLAVIGITISCVMGEHRRHGVRLALLLAVQTLFWLAFTHIKSRFMVPAIAPAAIAIGIAVAGTTAGLVAPITRQIVNATIAILLTIYALLPVTTFASERSGAPAAAIGAIDGMTGASHAAGLARPGLTEAERESVRDSAPPVWWINHELPPGSRVFAVGEAAPLYYVRGRLDYQTTWDRGPLSAAMRKSDDPAEWVNTLREAGYTHVHVNLGMITVWQVAGWNDPLITVDRVVEFLDELDARARSLRRWRGGMTLHALEPR